ncbi:MAG: hypothetical protein RLZZ337_206 [Bacteroidota bacterium]|jgi:hypothetical protein
MLNLVFSICKKEQSIWVLLLFLSFSGCKKGDLIPNAAPDTFLSIESINLSGENRLNSTVNLTWFGTDIDGYVSHYEIKINEGEWQKTTLQDSTFLFEINPNEDSTDINFYVRAIDNENQEDPSAAYLKVPLKNSPPIVHFETATLPIDTTNLVITFRFRASDPDGDNTLKHIYLRANAGDWQEIDLNQKLVSVIPQKTEQLGAGNASLYYGLSTNVASTINGFNNGGDNILQLKVTDIANAESKVDSTSIIYVKPQTSDLLVVSGHNDGIAATYKELISAAYGNADYVNFAGNNGLNQPRFWDPSFRLLASNYDKVFFHSNEATFTNPLTGADGKMLDFAAPIIQNLIDNRKKVMVTTAFATGVDLSTMGGVLSIDSLSSSRGQAFFTSDSFAVSNDVAYPPLQPSSFLLATDPFYPALEAEILYNAQLTPSGGWVGPRVMAIRRKNLQNKVNLVVFTIEFHRLDKLKSNQLQTLSKILNEAFNW